MHLLRDSLQYIQDNPGRFRRRSDPRRFSLYALLIAIALFFPLGILTSRSRRIGPTVIGLIAAARVVPSISVLFLLFPVPPGNRRSLARSGCASFVIWR